MVPERVDGSTTLTSVPRFSRSLYWDPLSNDLSATIRNVPRAEAIWARILGTGLILIGLTLLASPWIAYRTREKIPHTRYSVKGEKVLVVPRAAAVLLIAAGVTALIIAARKPSS